MSSGDVSALTRITFSPLAAQALRVFRVVDHLARCRARPRVETLGHLDGLTDLLRVEYGPEDLVEPVRAYPHERLFLVDQALPDHVDGGLELGEGGPLARPRLEHPELSALDGELDVLHVLKAALQDSADLQKLQVNLRHRFFEGRHGRVCLLRLVDGQGRPCPGHHVLALGIQEIFAVEDILPGGGVSREGDARAGILPDVAEDHALDVDRRPPGGGYVVEPPVGLGPRVVPGLEDGPDGAPQLLQRVFGEVDVQLLLD